jgi:hypothetical protein
MKQGSDGEQAIEKGRRVGEFGFLDHQRRRQQDQVAARGERDAGGHCLVHQRLERRRCLRPRRQRRARGAVGHQFDHDEQAVAATHVADDRMARLQVLHVLEQARTERARAFDQAIVGIGGERGDAGGARERMAAIGQAGVEHLVFDACGDFATQHHGAERCRRAGQALGQGHQIGAADSPWRCQANHSPQRPKALITSSAIKYTPRFAVARRNAGQ